MATEAGGPRPPSAFAAMLRRHRTGAGLSHDVLSALFALRIPYWRYARQRDRGSLLGVATVLLTLGEDGIQRLETGIHPRCLASNAFYRVIQAISFAPFFAAARDFLEAADQPAPIQATTAASLGLLGARNVVHAGPCSCLPTAGAFARLLLHPRGMLIRMGRSITASLNSVVSPGTLG